MRPIIGPPLHLENLASSTRVAHRWRNSIIPIGKSLICPNRWLSLQGKAMLVEQLLVPNQEKEAEAGPGHGSRAA